MLKRNKIMWALMGAATLGVIVAMVAIPLGKLNEYNQYVKDYNDAQSEGTYELTSLSAELSDEVIYFDNGKAEPKKDDFKVSGTYVKVGDETDSYRKKIKSADFEMTVPEDFADQGGTISFSYEGLLAQLPLTLTDVVPERIEVTNLPYKTVYRPGETYVSAGLEVSLVTNDGEVSIIDKSNLTFSYPERLDYGDAEVHITYKDNDVSLSTSYEVYINEEPTLYEYIQECKRESKSLDFMVTTVVPKTKKSEFYMQGGCTDGQYGYYMINVSGNTTGRVHKFDVANGTLIGTSDVLTLSPSSTFTDNGNLFIYQDNIYVIKSDFTYEVVNRKTLETVENPTPLEFGGISNANAVDYSYFNKKFAVCNGSQLAIYDEASLSTPFKTASVSCSASGQKFSSLYTTSDAIYVVYIANNTGRAYLEAYTWGGLSLGESVLYSPALNVSTTNNIQNIIEIGGAIYVGILDWDNGYYIFKLTCKGNHYYASPTLINYLISSKSNNTTPVINATGDERKVLDRYSLESGFNTVQSVCTDGVYQYYAFDNTSNTKCKVARFDLSTGTFDLKSVELPVNNTTEYPDPNVTLSYVDGDLILTTRLDTYYTLDAETLNLKSNSLFFPDFKGSLLSVERDAKSGKWAVINRTGWLYLYDKSLNLLKTTQITGHSGYSISNSGSTKDYIYTYYIKDGSNTLPFTVMDWSGNIVGTYSAENMGYDGGGSSRNIQTYCEMDGVGYVGTLTWAGGYGLFLYSVSWGE